MDKIKIALLAGGISGEREVSLKTAAKIYEALDKNKYEIFRYDPQNDLKKFTNDAIDKKFDLVMPALHGPFGEDGRLQGMLDMLGMPYVFSGCLASAVAMNKNIAKLVVASKGVPIIPDLIIRKGEYGANEIINSIGLPLVIKPIELGSSVGMSIAQNKKDLEEGIELAFKFNEEILLEKYIKGRELTVTILKNNPPQALSVIEIIPKTSTWFDFKAKYEPGASEEVCPANIPDKIKEEVQNYALLAHQSIGCKDLARADFIWDEENNSLYFLEINTIPGMTETSLAPQAAKDAGLSFPELLDELIQMNLK